DVRPDQVPGDKVAVSTLNCNRIRGVARDDIPFVPDDRAVEGADPDPIGGRACADVNTTEVVSERGTACHVGANEVTGDRSGVGGANEVAVGFVVAGNIDTE